MNRSTVFGLGLLLGGVLMGALVAAERLVNTSAPPSAPEPVLVAPLKAPVEVAPLEAQRPVEAAQQVDAGVVARPSLIPAANADDGSETADGTYAFGVEDSREIEYAFQLVVGPNSTVETAKNAAEVFERCLKQFPQNARCYQGLVQAQQRQKLVDYKPPKAGPALMPGPGRFGGATPQPPVPGAPLRKRAPIDGKPVLADPVE